MRIDSSDQMETSISKSVQPRRTFRVSETPSYLKDYHCYSVIESLYKPTTYREASSNPLWQQAITDELQALNNVRT